jgi:hypothetical protein
MQKDSSEKKQKKTSSSSNSTVCSTPPPHDLYSYLIAEEHRYRQKGYGLIFAILIASSFFYFTPIMG